MERRPTKLLYQGILLEHLIWVHGYTHQEVADKIGGLSRPHLTNICKGMDPLTDELAERIARFLGVVPGRLMAMESESRRIKQRKKANASKRRTKKL